MAETLKERSERLARESENTPVIDRKAGDIPTSVRIAENKVKIERLSEEARVLGATETDIEALGGVPSPQDAEPPAGTEVQSPAPIDANEFVENEQAITEAPVDTSVVPPDTAEVSPEEPAIQDTPAKDPGEILVTEEPTAEDKPEVLAGTGNSPVPSSPLPSEAPTITDDDITDELFGDMRSFTGGNGVTIPEVVGDRELTEEDITAEIFKDSRRNQIKNFNSDVVDQFRKEWTLEGETAHLARQMLTGASNVPDIGLGLLSLAAMLDEEGLFEDIDEGFLGTMEVAANSIYKAVKKPYSTIGTLAAEQVARGGVVRALTDELIPQTDSNTTFGYWLGKFVEGGTESLVIAVKMADQARKLSGNFDSVPPFLRPIYKELADNPTRIFRQETFSGAFALLSSDGAYRWALDNIDDPAMAPIIGLIAGVAGSTVKNPFGIPLQAKNITIKSGHLLTKLAKGGARKTLKIIGLLEEGGESARYAFNEHQYGKFFKQGVSMLAGEDPQGMARSLLEEAVDDPILRELIIAITDDLSITGDFKDALVKAQKTALSVDGLVLTTANITDDAVISGISKALNEIDPKVAVRQYAANVKATNKFLDTFWKRADSETREIIEEFSAKAYNQAIVDHHETLNAVQKTLNELNLAEDIGDIASGKILRARLSALDDMMSIQNNTLHRIDPFNEVTISSDSLSSIMKDPNFSNFNQSNELGSGLRLAYGAALAKTLRTRLGEGGDLDKLSVNSKAVPDPKKFTQESFIKRIENGDISAMQGLNVSQRRLNYNDAAQLGKDLNDIVGTLKTSQTTGIGTQARSALIISKRYSEEFMDVLRKEGHGQVADQHRLANDFHREYIGGYFDPSNTATGQIVRDKRYDHFAIQNSDVLDEIFDNPNEVERFLKLLDPTDGAAPLVNPGDTKFAKYLSGKNVDVLESAPEELGALRRAMEAHIYAEADKIIIRAPDNPAKALNDWMLNNKQSLDQFPEIQKILAGRAASPSLSSPAIFKAQETRYLAKLHLDRVQMTHMFGEGSFGKNSLGILTDERAAKQMDRAFTHADPSGKMRKFFVSEAIREVLTPDGNLAIDPAKVEDFLNVHRRGLEIIDPDTVKNLEDLLDATRITARGKVKAGTFDVNIDSGDTTAKFMLQQMASVWTSLRSREVFGANRTMLMLIHAGKLGTKQLQKLDNKTSERMGRVFSAMMSDPQVAAEFGNAAKHWVRAVDSTAKGAAHARLATAFAGFGIPLLGVGPAITGAGEGAGDVEKKTQEIKEKARKSQVGEPQ